MIADDLFAGAGGWDLAAAELGIHARGVENMKEARATRDAAGLTTIHDDVWTFEPDGTAEGLIASPPCQTFSTAGKGAGRKALDDVLSGIREGFYQDRDALRFFGMTVGDDRTGLVLTPLHFALTGGYKWTAWEQVPAVLPVWQMCAAILRGHGWNAWAGLLHAENYGVPQNRKRAVLIASLDREASPPLPEYRFPRTLSQALGWPSDSVVHHIRGAGMTERHGPRPGRRGDQPCFTVTSKARSWEVVDVGYGRRRFTIEEAARVQTFPANFPWQGSRSSQFLQVGNAVPPLFAKYPLAAASGIRREVVAA